MADRHRIAVITPDVLQPRMAGPAIRALNIATALVGDGHDVLLVSTASCEISRDDVRCVYAPWHRLRVTVADYDVVVIQGFVSYHAPWLLSSAKVVVVDLYDPMHLEQLVQMADRPQLERQASVDLTTRVLNDQLVRGDFFICASERQRLLWLGQLAAMGRVNPVNFDRDPDLRSLIDVCPFGLPSEPPEHTAPAIRGVVEGVGATDKVILWAGGVYNWFDPLTLVRAVDRLRQQHDDVRLFFLGMQHPNPDVPMMSMATDTRRLAAELGLVGRHVFFNEGWVQHDQRGSYLLEADVGVSTHFEHVETAFSFRTRILDYLWAGLPIVCTQGDGFAELVEKEALGVAVPERDVEALADALALMLYDERARDDARAAVDRVRGRFTWDNALSPLVGFCRDPRRAPDAGTDQRRFARRPVPPATAVGREAARAATLVREGGASLLVERIRARGRRLISERRGGDDAEPPGQAR